MSNFLVAVGGSGAKLMLTMIHLSAAGLLPATKLHGLLVDPDQSNGNVADCQETFSKYQACRNLLKLGSSDLLGADVSLAGPWTPIETGQAKPISTLKEIFKHDAMKAQGHIDAELLNLFFEADELDTPLQKGFRARPAIGATIMAQSVRFGDDIWKEFKDRVETHAQQGARVLLAGSVFGGSGAAGVPTLVRLFEQELGEHVRKPYLGLVLVLPFFQFRPVDGEKIQADPTAFAAATAEAIKYYHEGGFLNFCDSIFCVGEEVPSQVAVSAVGAKEQCNEPHFVELIGGMGAIKFFSDRFDSASEGNPGIAQEGKPGPARQNYLAVAGREVDGTIQWKDLPCIAEQRDHDRLVSKLQHMAVFAVAYHYIFYPIISAALVTRGWRHLPFYVDHIQRQKDVAPEHAGDALEKLDKYIQSFLSWLLHISTPRRANFIPGLVDPNVFAFEDRAKSEWRLKEVKQVTGVPADQVFQHGSFANLLKNRHEDKRQLNDRLIFQRATYSVQDSNAVGVGRLVRALYDACAVN